MSERSNQTAEIALRYYIATLEDLRLWPTVLGRLSASLNNSTKYSSTARTPTQVMYGFRTREALDFLRIDNPDEAAPCDEASQPAISQPAVANASGAIEAARSPGYPATRPATRAPAAAMDEYRPSHIDAKDAITLAAIKMKEYYDAKHLPQFFDTGNLVNLRLHKGYRVPGITSKKIGPQLVGPFKIVERIGRLAYRLELPENMLIHDVISIAYLEPATDPAMDPYQRRRLPAPAVVVDGEEEFEIEKLLQKRRIRRGRGWSTQYLVRWLGYGPEFDQWMPEHRLAHAPDLVQEFERTFGMEAGLRS